mgnify:CR=1 FL=1
MSNSTPRERRFKRNYFILGLVIASAISYGINQQRNQGSDYVCQKGILFGQITSGGDVYLKTEEECLTKTISIPTKKESE